MSALAAQTRRGPATLPAEAAAGTLAARVGISERRIRELVAGGVLPRTARGRFPLPGAVTAYCAHLREIAAGRGGEAGVQDLTTERARLAREQADGHALRNAQLRGDLLEAAAVARSWADVLRTVRAGVLASPSRIRAELPHLTQADAEVIDRVLRDALTVLAGGARPPIDAAEGDAADAG